MSPSAGRSWPRRGCSCSTNPSPASTAVSGERSSLPPRGRGALRAGDGLRQPRARRAPQLRRRRAAGGGGARRGLRTGARARAARTASSACTTRAALQDPRTPLGRAREGWLGSNSLAAAGRERSLRGPRPGAGEVELLLRPEDVILARPPFEGRVSLTNQLQGTVARSREPAGRWWSPRGRRPRAPRGSHRARCRAAGAGARRGGGGALQGSGHALSLAGRHLSLRVTRRSPPPGLMRNFFFARRPSSDSATSTY